LVRLIIEISRSGGERSCPADEELHIVCRELVLILQEMEYVLFVACPQFAWAWG